MPVCEIVRASALFPNLEWEMIWIPKIDLRSLLPGSESGRLSNSIETQVPRLQIQHATLGVVEGIRGILDPYITGTKLGSGMGLIECQTNISTANRMSASLLKASPAQHSKQFQRWKIWQRMADSLTESRSFVVVEARRDVRYEG
jgi:hypothetical protein